MDDNQRQKINLEELQQLEKSKDQCTDLTRASIDARINQLKAELEN